MYLETKNKTGLIDQFLKDVEEINNAQLTFENLDTKDLMSFPVGPWKYFAIHSNESNENNIENSTHRRLSTGLIKIEPNKYYFIKRNPQDKNDEKLVVIAEDMETYNERMRRERVRYRAIEREASH